MLLSKRNHQQLGLCVAAFAPSSPTKVSEFKGHLVHGSNMVADKIHIFHKDFVAV